LGSKKNAMSAPSTPSPQAGPGDSLHALLIGTSLDEGCDQVVRSGLAVARAAGARASLVHATRIEPLPVGGETEPAPWLEREQIIRREEMLSHQLGRLGIRKADLDGAAVLPGAPGRVLTEIAQTVGIDLIVVGAGGAGPLAVESLGSIADRVSRKADCPVLLLRGEMPVPPPRVLAPVDLSALSADALQRGLQLLTQLAKNTSIELKVVFALSFADALVLQRQKGGEICFEDVERCCAAELERLVLEIRHNPRILLETAVLPGEARFEILGELRRRPVDLVVLGTHGRGGPDRLMLGSVASTVARKARCSVLLIPPQASPGESHLATALQYEPAFAA